MLDCDKKQRCIVGPNAGIAYNPAFPCFGNETFNEELCDCELYFECDCSCHDDCPECSICVGGTCQPDPECCPANYTYNPVTGECEPENPAGFWKWIGVVTSPSGSLEFTIENGPVVDIPEDENSSRYGYPTAWTQQYQTRNTGAFTYSPGVDDSPPFGGSSTAELTNICTNSTPDSTSWNDASFTVGIRRPDGSIASATYRAELLVPCNTDLGATLTGSGSWIRVDEAGNPI